MALGANRKLFPQELKTRTSHDHKQDARLSDGASGRRVHRRQRYTPLLPVGGMAMAKGGNPAITPQSTTNATAKSHRRPKLQANDDLPPAAAALKRRIWESHPQQLYKFRLGKMKHVVQPPVEIPPDLADPNVRTRMVSGKAVAVTRFMWQQQRDQFRIKRLPSRIREGCAY
ncbi:hypothetical protein PHYBOEH_007854 [Phytophthora boehmeriae]|uniref:Uncharacterized protein n=1 Tax=Phytophthora boehmeriae TaxID=109152 RepID=A0A8T1W3I5_9STRA|nr:hypothetical protein PHYBOEH_007854 [Phytophthora boehmeriae]